MSLNESGENESQKAIIKENLEQGTFLDGVEAGNDVLNLSGATHYKKNTNLNLGGLGMSNKSGAEELQKATMAENREQGTTFNVVGAGKVRRRKRSNAIDFGSSCYTTYKRERVSIGTIICRGILDLSE